MKKTDAKWIFVGIVIVFSFAFNIAAWNSRAFADFYTDRIFPVITTPYARLTSIFPFSVGELYHFSKRIVQTKQRGRNTGIPVDTTAEKPVK